MRGSWRLRSLRRRTYDAGTLGGGDAGETLAVPVCRYLEGLTSINQQLT